MKNINWSKDILLCDVNIALMSSDRIWKTVIPVAEVCSVILLLVFAELRCFIGVDLLHFFSEMFCFLLAGSILFVCLASFECLPTVHVQWAVNVVTCTNVLLVLGI